MKKESFKVSYGYHDVSTSKQFGETLEELSKQFGRDVVTHAARRGLIDSFRRSIRSQLITGKKPETIKKWLKSWKPFQTIFEGR